MEIFAKNLKNCENALLEKILKHLHISADCVII